MTDTVKIHIYKGELGEVLELYINDQLIAIPSFAIDDESRITAVTMNADKSDVIKAIGLDVASPKTTSGQFFTPEFSCNPSEITEIRIIPKSPDNPLRVGIATNKSSYVFTSDDHKVPLAALKALLDCAWYKPAQYQATVDYFHSLAEEE